MIGQVLVDGIGAGALIGLGAIGVTLTYGLLRFANFAHGEFVTAGAYAALVVAGAFGEVAPIGPLTFGWSLLAALAAAMACVGGLALLLDAALFRRLRRHGNAIVLVIASFGASLALRSLLEFAFGGEPRYYTTDIAIAVRLAPGMRATADQLVVLAVALLLMLATHLLMTRTALGRAMRAVSENPDLARLAGLDAAGVVRATWLLGGALAAASGVFLGATVQLRPGMGFDLLLPLFAAAILGGIGSVPGAMAGGMVIGLVEAAAVPLAGAQYRSAIAFLALLAVLLLRPRGLFGTAD
ncbi:MAG: branched-chain amino acid ABC transporter permease [Acidisphaera sp.]|nr:branched-chain amino acid ABC transporter permease [Acidisphaera sp.]MBV9813163.1 branched-chain amino acid ABC transporter permease [Acetobacteraceae bacterium]